MNEKKEFIAHFTVKGGKPLWKNETYFRLNFPKYEGLQGMLVVKKKWNKRSNQQNAYMWVCFEEIAKYTGHTAEEVHTICKGLYCPRKQVELNKEHSYAIPKGTSELTVGEMVEFMLDVTALASSLGIILQSPEEYQREQGIIY